MIRVLIVDDQRLMREGLRTLLGSEADIEIVGLAVNGVEAVQMTSATAPDVILMDIRMPVQDGISATREVMQVNAMSKVLVLTTYDEVDDVVQAMSAGASGYLLKDMPAEAIAAAIRAVYEGGAVLAPHLVKAAFSGIGSVAQSPIISTEYPSETLTDRELDVLRQLACGLSNREIARMLFVTEGTVKNHVSNLIAKLGLRDRTQIALYAVRQGYGPSELLP
ncbi:MAG: response regulator [Bacilli bacterium]